MGKNLFFLMIILILVTGLFVLDRHLRKYNYGKSPKRNTAHPNQLKIRIGILLAWILMFSILYFSSDRRFVSGSAFPLFMGVMILDGLFDAFMEWRYRKEKRYYWFYLYSVGAFVAAMATIDYWIRI